MYVGVPVARCSGIGLSIGIGLGLGLGRGFGRGFGRGLGLVGIIELIICFE